MKKYLMVAMMAAALPLFALPALADEQVYTLSIQDHKFTPETLEIPANTKVKLLVKNLDSTPEEFESHDLKREKVIKGKSEAIIPIGPLKPGVYKFFGEFHEATAKGKLIVE